MPRLTMRNVDLATKKKPKPKPKPKRPARIPTSAEVRAAQLRTQIRTLLHQRACTVANLQQIFRIKHHLADRLMREIWRTDELVERQRQPGRGRGYIYYTPETKPKIQRQGPEIFHKDRTRLPAVAGQLHRLLLATPDQTIDQIVERTVYTREVIVRVLNVLALARLVLRDESTIPAHYRPAPNTQTYDGV